MATLKNRPPSYHRHNAFGQAIVTINDRHQHLGNDRSLESQTQDRGSSGSGQPWGDRRH